MLASRGSVSISSGYASKDDVKRLDNLMGLVVIVLFGVVVTLLLTAGAMINDSLAEKKAISQDMRDKISQQNLELEHMRKSMDDLTEAVRAQ